MKKPWKKVMPVVLGSSLFATPLMADARELTDETYTTSINRIDYGNHTVSNGDVTLDASGYTGAYNNQRSIISTLNGAVNIDISEGNTLTIKGFNYNSADYYSALHAHKRGNLSGTMTFTGGNVVVSNHATSVNSFSSYGMYGNEGGQFDFKSDGDNKINLTVYVPVSGKSTNRTGIYLNDSALNFDGGNLTVNLDGVPAPNLYNSETRTGININDSAFNFNGKNLTVSINGDPTPNPYNSESRTGISTYDSDFTFNGEDFTVSMDSNFGSGGRRTGLNINNSEFDLNGKNFSVRIDGNPESGTLENQVGMRVYGGSNVDINAEHISIESDGYALRMGNYASYDPVNTAKFEADTLIFRSRGGIHVGNHAYALGIYDGIRNTLEFTGHTLIESIARGGEDDTYRLNSNGQALSLVGTDITFNSDRGVTVYSENLTPQGLIPEIVGDLAPLEPEPYWLRAVSLIKDTELKANTDFSITSNGGYYNVALYVSESQAQFNGKTSLTVKNGIDTARGIYLNGGVYGRPTKAEFNDDLSISLADTQAGYISGIEAVAGGKVDVKKGCLSMIIVTSTGHFMPAAWMTRVWGAKLTLIPPEREPYR
ncbi:hypothetical protein [Limnobaculum xujianqingii]|uniref:hypothetical protein n=1 Tax=Limnobaculum xujianqingii TaxID=2738837 RepID=UPI0015BD69A2|nr:hypothetical protein [Limnobaculum xujianqingii]